MRVPVVGHGSFVPGVPTKLFESNIYIEDTPGTGVVGGCRTYDISLDGLRFLVGKNGAGAGSDQARMDLIVVEHWLEKLKRLVPSK